MSIETNQNQSTKQEFQTIVENSPDQIIRYDHEFRRVYVNPAVTKLYGIPMEAIIGETIGSLSKKAGLNTNENNIALLKQHIQSVFDTGESIEFEITWTMPKGRRTLSTRMFPEFDQNRNVKTVVGIARDITEFKETQRRILELTENSPDIIARFDNEGRYLYVNQSIEKILGVTRQELLGKVFGEILSEHVYPDVPHEFLSIRHAIRKVFESGSPIETEVSISLSGKKRFFNIRLFPEFNESEHIVSVLHIGREITEQRQMEEAKRQSEQLFATAFQSSPVALSITRLKDGKFIEVNKKFLELFGYDREEAIGHTSIELKMYESIEERNQNVRLMREQGGVREFEVRTRTKSGKGIDVFASNIQIELEGEPQILSFTIDLTERKRAEEILKASEAKLRTIFDIAPTGISILNSTGNIIELNPALENIMQMSRNDLLTGMYRNKQCINDENLPISPRDFPSSRALIEQRVIKDMEIGVVQDDGKVLWNSVSAAPIPIEGMGVVVLTTSIDERKKVENELRTTQFRLQLLSRRLLEVQENERRMLARELHDEIGQILTAVKIDLEVLRQNELQDNLRIRLDDDIITLDKCLHQVRNLSLNLRPSILDDLGLIASLRWQLKRQTERAGFKAHFITDEIPLRLHTDIETTCFRVVQETLTNISRHAKAKNVDIIVRIENKNIFLTVRDDGIGFDVANAFTNILYGKTFGLLSMQERVNLLGGNLEINSTIGEGTAIKVILPLILSETNE